MQGRGRELHVQGMLRRPIAARMVGQRKVTTPLWNSLDEFISDFGVFLFGVAGAFSLDIVGSLPGDEVLIFPLLPALLLARGSRAFRRQYLWFYIMVGAWLLGTIVADVYAGSPAENRMKGTARVVFFALDFMALAILVNNKTRRLVIFSLSIAVVMLIDTRQFSGDFPTQWKFGYSGAAAIASLLFSSTFYARRRYWIPIVIALILAGLNLILGYRSELGIVVVSTVLILPLLHQSQVPGKSRSFFGPIFLLLLAGIAAYFANVAIKQAATRGYFDESVNFKFESQESGDYGVLVGGRPETLVAIQAIRDSPIIGHGSYPYGPKYIQLKQDIQYEHGYTDTDVAEDVEVPVIPTHSHLTMAWVESGILGGICWIYFLLLALRSALRLATLRPTFTPLYCFLLIGFLWDILYSPFGSVNRLWAAYLIILSYKILNDSGAVARRIPERMTIYRRSSRIPPMPGKIAYQSGWFQRRPRQS